jgi:hypothetical protein
VLIPENYLMTKKNYKSRYYMFDDPQAQHSSGTSVLLADSR